MAPLRASSSEKKINLFIGFFVAGENHRIRHVFAVAATHYYVEEQARVFLAEITIIELGDNQTAWLDQTTGYPFVLPGPRSGR